MKKTLAACALLLTLAAGCASTRPGNITQSVHPATEQTLATIQAKIQPPSERAGIAPEPIPPTPSQGSQVRLVSSNEAVVERVPPAAAEAVTRPVPLQGATAAPAPELYPLDLPTALRLADGGNYQIALAREQIRQAWARANYTETQWLPSLRTGFSYNKHEGSIQSVEGDVFNVSRDNLFAGLGAGAASAGSPVAPGLYANFHLADALFNPLAARQAAGARRSAAAATTNDVLLRVALSYLEVLRSAEELTIAQDAREDARELAELTSAYAQTGQGLSSDADRAATELSTRKNEVLRALEERQVASARLAQLLRLEPTLTFDPVDRFTGPVELVAKEEPVGNLIAQALTTRPELTESRFLVSQAVQKMRRESYACLVPSIILGASYGGFGGGPGDTIANFDNRMDADVVAFWELRNLGFGDRAARDEARSLVRQANVNRMSVLDQVAREVAEAHTQVVFRGQQIEIGRQAVESATSAHARNIERIKALQGLPIEVLQSNQALALARREYLRVVIDYNIAQFTLYRALGWSALCAELPTR